MKDDAPRWESLSLAVPPIVLVGVVTADTFYDALFVSEFSKAVELFIAKARRKARACVALREADGDSKNKRLMTYELNTMLGSPLADSCFHVYSQCGVHDNNHLVGDMATIIGMDIIDSHFSYTKLVRMGNYWTRTRQANAAVAEELHVEYTRPSPSCIELWDMIIDMFVLPPQPGRERKKKNLPPTPQQFAIWHALKDECKRMFNAMPSSSGFVHHCHRDFCRCTSVADSRKRFRRCMHQCCYHARRKTPQAPLHKFKHFKHVSIFDI